MLSLNLLAIRERSRALTSAARRSRPVADASPVTRVTLRYGAAADDARLARLAELDESPALEGVMLVAEVDGRIRAALALDGGRSISDPFHRGAELLGLLRLRARQLGYRG
jgi:hypothetical protein